MIDRHHWPFVITGLILILVIALDAYLCFRSFASHEYGSAAVYIAIPIIGAIAAFSSDERD